MGFFFFVCIFLIVAAIFIAYNSDKIKPGDNSGPIYFPSDSPTSIESPSWESSSASDASNPADSSCNDATSDADSYSCSSDDSGSDSSSDSGGDSSSD